MKLLFKIRALEITETRDYDKTPTEIIKHTKITLDGGKDDVDSIYLSVPFTNKLHLSQEMEVNFHIEELLK